MKSIERFERIKKWIEGDFSYTNEKEIDEDFNEIHKSLEKLSSLKQIKISKMNNGYLISYNGENSFVGEKLGKLLEELEK